MSRKGFAPIVTVLIIALFMIAGSLYYYYVVFMPKEEKAKLEQLKLYQQKQEQIATKELQEMQKLEKLKGQETRRENSQALDNCLNDVKKSFQGKMNEWRKESDDLYKEFEYRGKDPGLLRIPGFITTEVPPAKPHITDDYWQQLINECYKKYSQK